MNNLLRHLIVKGQKRLCLLFTLLLLCLISAAQSISPSTINISGQSATFGNYRFEWSVGEQAATNTMNNGNIIVTNGLLQDYVVENQPAINPIGSWSSEEIRFFPNPVITVLEINILHRMIGRNQLLLFDINGKKVKERQFEYYGLGTTEKWDLSNLPAGLYILNIQQISSVTGRVFKKGAFKIIKI